MMVSIIASRKAPLIQSIDCSSFASSPLGFGNSTVGPLHLVDS